MLARTAKEVKAQFIHQHLSRFSHSLTILINFLTSNRRYDDPANYAPEEDQYRRSINPYNQSVGYCGPEYDDPANCAPEEDQYGSQYGGKDNYSILTDILNLNLL